MVEWWAPLHWWWSLDNPQVFPCFPSTENMGKLETGNAKRDDWRSSNPDIFPQKRLDSSFGFYRIPMLIVFLISSPKTEMILGRSGKTQSYPTTTWVPFHINCVRGSFECARAGMWRNEEKSIAFELLELWEVSISQIESWIHNSTSTVSGICLS